MAAETLVLIFLTIVIGLLLFVYRQISRADKRRERSAGPRHGSTSDGSSEHRRAGKNGRPARLPCPLCGSLLEKGETVHSHVYRAGTDSLSHIFGCPYCSSAAARRTTNGNPTGGSRNPGKSPPPYQGESSPQPLKKRNCPVCRRTIPPEGYLVARMFEKRVPGSDGRPRTKTHVHVLGCTECRKR